MNKAWADYCLIDAESLTKKASHQKKKKFLEKKMISKKGDGNKNENAGRAREEKHSDSKIGNQSRDLGDMKQ